MAKKCDCKAVNKKIIKEVLPEMPDIKILEDISAFFKIMGDETRIRLLWALDFTELCVSDLANVLNMTKSAVSHQLKTLKDARLVKSIKQGKIVYYSLADKHVRLIFEKAIEHVLEQKL